ncbi:MAG: hypothetical protein KJ667_08280, partial [Alphaproteobacteria bacterium]|nr:hypothetical protein [Alphaproteobacteria bacterium]
MTAAFPRVLILGAVLALTGCETMSATMASARDKITSFEMPSLSSKRNAAEDLPADQLLVASQSVDCPRVGVVDDLNSLTQMTEGGAEISSAQLIDIQSQCTVNENNVIVDMDIVFDAAIGAQGRVKDTDTASFSYPYFIAITTPSGDITAKEVFSATIAFESGTDRLNHAEQLRQVIPLTGAYNARDYEILIGFQLSESELAFNRNRAAQGMAPTPTRIHNVKPSAAAPAPAATPAPAMAPAAAPAPAPIEMQEQVSSVTPAVNTTTLAPAAAPAPAPVAEPNPAPRPPEEEAA